MTLYCSWCRKPLAADEVHKCPKRPGYVRRGEERAKELKRRSF